MEEVNHASNILLLQKKHLSPGLDDQTHLDGLILMQQLASVFSNRCGTKEEPATDLHVELLRQASPPTSAFLRNGPRDARCDGMASGSEGRGRKRS